MAINKRSTPTWVKVVIVLVAAAFVALPVVSAISSSASFRGSSSNSNGTADAFTTISQKYAGQTQAFEQQLASEPTSYTVLVNQGNTYYDWAAEVQQNTKLAQAGAAQPIWLSATTYYSRALQAKAGDPSVTTDLAIAYFNAGQTSQAISTVEKVFKSSPKFAPAYFNGGVFYGAAGRNAEAVAAYEKYLKLDPNGTQGKPDVAKQEIQKLKGASSTTTTTP